MFRFLKCATVILTCIMMLTASSLYAFAKTESDETDQSILPDRIIVCADKGFHEDYPENSIEAFNAAGCEYVSADVRLTKDGVPVLMEDETVDRMCVSADGKAVHGKVSDYTFDEISNFYLKKGTGVDKEKTDIKVASLEQAAKRVNEKIIVLDLDFDDIDAVLSKVNTDEYRARFVLRIDGSNDKIIEKLSSYDKVPNVILKYNGNIIFSVNSTIKKASQSGLGMVQLGTKNHHGVIFYKSVEKKIGKNGLAAAYSMAEPYNARRQDNVSGWDNVISHGYTFIETDHPDLLQSYISDCEQMRSKLNVLISERIDYESGNYPKDLKFEYEKAYDYAVETANKASSLSQLGNAYTSLEKAADAISGAESESTASSLFHFSAGRIITVVLCLAAVVAAQVYLYKRRQTENSNR